MLHRRRGVLAVLLVALAAVPIAARAAGASPCIDDPNTVHDLTLDVDGQTATGKYTFPAAAPKGLVVFFHGYGHDSTDWSTIPEWESTQPAAHLQRVAANDGVVAVAMDHHGTDDTHTWQVQEGADDSIAAAQHLAELCDLSVVVAYGVSMGGNASGLALADAPAGLFDWWFAIEGAHNVIETYHEARAVAQSGNAFANEAQRGIELEMGGTFEEVPDAYAAHTNLARAAEIAASGIQGVVMVHAVDDGLVPYNQSREMQAALQAQAIPVQFWTVGSGPHPKDTTADSYVPVPHDRFLAGHSNESSYESLVSRIGFDRLDALFNEAAYPSTPGEFVRDGASDTYTKP